VNLLISKCDYCDTRNIEVRGTPFMADIPAKMCEECWDITKEEYENSDGVYIGEFKKIT
jgi:hypothetical protein